MLNYKKLIELIESGDFEVAEKLTVSEIGATHIDKIVAVTGKVKAVGEKKGTLKVIAYVCEDGHVTEVENPLIEQPKRLETCPKCGKPVRVDLDKSLPVDILDIVLTDGKKEIKAFLLGKAVNTEVKEGEEVELIAVVKGKLDETTFTVTVSHLEAFIVNKPEKAEEKEEKKKEVRTIADILEREEKEEVKRVAEDLNEVISDKPKVVATIRHGGVWKGQIEKIWEYFWTEWQRHVKDKVTLEEVDFIGEIIGTTLYLTVALKGKAKISENDVKRNASYIFSKIAPKSHIGLGLRIVLRNIEANVVVEKKEKKEKKRKLDLGILSTLAGEEIEEAEEEEVVSPAEERPLVRPQIVESYKVTKEHISIIRDIMLEVEEDFPSLYGISVEEVMKRAEKKGIARAVVEKALSIMREQGMIEDGLAKGYVKLKR